MGFIRVAESMPVSTPLTPEDSISPRRKSLYRLEKIGPVRVLSTNNGIFRLERLESRASEKIPHFKASQAIFSCFEGSGLP